MIQPLPIIEALCVPRFPRINGANRRRFKIQLHSIDPSCYWCGQEVNPKRCTLDHLMPHSRGGSDSPENLVLCCYRCNNIKAAMTVEEFLWLLERMAAAARSYLPPGLSVTAH